MDALAHLWLSTCPASPHPPRIDKNLGSGYRTSTGSLIFSLKCRYHRIRPDYECSLQYTGSLGLEVFTEVIVFNL